MLNISFAMTSDAYADGTKTETRRFWKPAHAAKFKPGTVFMGITKDFRAGGVRMHPARVMECYRERLGDMSGYSFSAEGGTRYWANRAAYIAMMGGPDNVPWVLRFEHLQNATNQTASGMNEPIKPGDRFQNGVMLTTDEIRWGSIQTVKRLTSDGKPIYRAKWGKVDKIADHWRTPPNTEREGRA
jgi:hypothetical protein